MDFYSEKSKFEIYIINTGSSSVCLSVCLYVCVYVYMCVLTNSS